MASIGVDGIIFGLQPVGGITTYAIEMLVRAAARGDATLELPRILKSLRASEIPATIPTRRIALPARLMQFCPAMIDAEVVLSTYYRTPLRARTKSLVTVYDFTYERYRTGLPRRVHAIQKSLACHRADAIACISASTRRDLLDAYPDIDPARVHVTPLAVDHDRFFPERALDAAHGGKVVFVGQRAGYKRFDLAREAVARAGLDLVVVGAPLSPDEKATLDRTLPGRWQGLSHIGDAALRRLYGAAYALIYPSDYEGFGLPVLEAQACGCPVIASDRSSLPEVGGDAAVYVRRQTGEDYAEALVDLADPDMRAKIVAQGLANARAFNWDRTWTMTEHLIKVLLDDPAPPMRTRTFRN